MFQINSWLSNQEFNFAFKTCWLEMLVGFVKNVMGVK